MLIVEHVLVAEIDREISSAHSIAISAKMPIELIKS